ncbi:MAG: SRPBCC domain-containing protein [Gemmatimonadota bacterium]
MTESARATRAIEIERHIDAPPEDVWAALTTGEGLKRWFVVDAKVDPKVGGMLWISWGPGMEGEAPIHIWEPHRRFGWTETHGTDDSGAPIQVVVDFEIAAESGGTTLRLVQSGFSAAAEWDEMFDATVDGWNYFFFNLAECVTRHAGKPRGLAWARLPTEFSRDEAWTRLVEGGLLPSDTTPEVTVDTPRPVSVVSSRRGHHLACTIPDLDDSILFVEFEGRHIGFWLSTYGFDQERVASLQADLDARVEATLGN